jgi:hypothetical protein
VGLGLYPNVPCGEHMRTHPLWREHEDTSRELYLDFTHYGELTLVFLEGVASISPHGSAMYERPFATMP